MLQSSLVQIQRLSQQLNIGAPSIASRLPAFLTPRVPSVFTFEVIAACNHKCAGCGNVFSRQLKSLPGSAWKEIITYIRPYVESFRITGGECTLHPDFASIIEDVDSVNVPFVVFTNGNWQNPDGVLEVFAKCKYLDGLLISLHGNSAETFRQFVITNAFENVVNNIRCAVHHGIRVGTNTILLKSNHKDIPGIVDFALSLGVSSVAFSRYYGEHLEGLELTEDEFHEALKTASEERAKDRRVVFNNCVPMCFTDIDIPTKGCTSGFTHCTIDPLGTVRPCTHSPYELGNIFEQSMEEIWHSDALKQWRNLIPLGCMDCGEFSSCRGGCRATAVHQGLTMDPLIRGPIKEPRHPTTEKLRIYRHARPKRRFKIREDDFGCYLINRSRHIAVSKDALPFIECINESTTFEMLYQKFGKIGIDFVGNLLAEGLIELA